MFILLVKPSDFSFRKIQLDVHILKRHLGSEIKEEHRNRLV